MLLTSRIYVQQTNRDHVCRLLWSGCIGLTYWQTLIGTENHPPQQKIPIQTRHICFCFAARPAPAPTRAIIHVYFTVTGNLLQPRNQSVSARLDVNANGCLATGGGGRAPFIMVGCSGCVSLIMLLLLFPVPSSLPLLQMIPAPELDPGRWAAIPLRLRSWPGSWVTTPSTPHTALARTHAWQIAQLKVFLGMWALCDVIRGASPSRGYGGD